MLKTLSLILPILLPSWRFFKTVEPSPRVQWALATAPEDWHSYRPRPEQVPWREMLRRLVWNPQWNQTLYVVSCAERLHLDPNPQTSEQIATRVGQEIRASGAAGAGALFRFRLVFVQRVAAQMEEEIVFVSPLIRLGEQPSC